MENKMIETAVFEKSACKSLIMDLIDKGGFETGKFVARFDSVWTVVLILILMQWNDILMFCIYINPIAFKFQLLLFATTAGKN